jgi:hypothetical protein
MTKDATPVCAGAAAERPRLHFQPVLETAKGLRRAVSRGMTQFFKFVTKRADKAAEVRDLLLIGNQQVGKGEDARDARTRSRAA